MLPVSTTTTADLKVMSNWCPRSFDDEILTLQPGCDLTFTTYGNEPDSLIGAHMQALAEQRNYDRPNQHEVYNMLSITNQNIGRQRTFDEITDESQREKETITMLRNAGCGPSTDENLNSKRTIPPIISSKPYSNAKFPILYDEQFFKLKPRKSDSSSVSTSGSDESHNIDAICTNIIIDNIKDNRRKCAITYLNQLENECEQQEQPLRDFNHIRATLRVYTPKELYEKRKRNTK